MQRPQHAYRFEPGDLTTSNGLPSGVSFLWINRLSGLFPSNIHTPLPTMNMKNTNSEFQKCTVQPASANPTIQMIHPVR